MSEPGSNADPPNTQILPNNTHLPNYKKLMAVSEFIDMRVCSCSLDPNNNPKFLPGSIPSLPSTMAPKSDLLLWYGKGVIP